MPSKNKTKNNKKGKKRTGRNRSQLSFVREVPTIPPLRKVMMTASMVGVIPASTLTAATTGYFIVFGNTGYQPFNTMYKPDSATGFVTEVNGSDTITANGESLYAQMYAFARSIRTGIRVSVVPSSGGDQVVLSVFATAAATLPSLPVSYSYSKSKLAFKEALCYQGNRLVDNTVTVFQDSARLLGMDKRQWKDLPPIPVTTAPTGTQADWYYVVQYFMADGALNTNTIPIRIEWCSEVEFYGPVENNG